VRLGLRTVALLGVAVLAFALGHDSHARTAAPAAHPAGSGGGGAPGQTAPARHRHGRHRVDAIDRAIRDNDYVARGTPHRKEVALTFDDGPGPQTRPLVRWLHAHGVPATFFVIGRNAAADPAAVRLEARDGFAIGDHTQSHAMLGILASSAQSAEIDQAAHVLHQITGRHIRLFRPPYGSFNATTLQLLRSDRILMVLWSIDTKDYTRPGVQRIVYTALSGARAGSILLMHDGGGPRDETVAAVPKIVHRLRLKGYRMVTVPQLLAADPPPRNQPPPHSLSGG